MYLHYFCQDLGSTKKVVGFLAHVCRKLLYKQDRGQPTLTQSGDKGDLAHASARERERERERETERERDPCHLKPKRSGYMRQ